MSAIILDTNGFHLKHMPLNIPLHHHTALSTSIFIIVYYLSVTKKYFVFSNFHNLGITTPVLKLVGRKLRRFFVSLYLFFTPDFLQNYDLCYVTLEVAIT